MPVYCLIEQSVSRNIIMDLSIVGFAPCNIWRQVLFQVSWLVRAVSVMPVCVSLAGTGYAFAEQPYQVEWIRQIGSTESDGSNAIAVDLLGNVFISGFTTGDLGGPGLGERDVFLTKYDSFGIEQWTRHSGTRDDDNSFSVAVDSTGSTYITGYSKGNIDGPNPGYSYHDAYLTKFDPSGVELWSKWLGSINQDYGFALDVDDSDNVYVSGSASGSLGGPHSGHADAFLIKYNVLGEEIWSRQIGTQDNDVARSVSVDNAGNVFISGSTFSNLGGPNAGFDDAFVAKFDPSGDDLWVRQIGTASRDNSTSVVVDNAGNVFITGFTSGNYAGVNQGFSDVYLTKFDPDGTELWSRQVGTSSSEASYSVAVDQMGGVYITGGTGHDLAGPHVGGIYDAFLIKFDSMGSKLWSQQLGTTGFDESTSMDVDSEGNIYISGYTGGSFDGVNEGGYDAFLIKLVAPLAGDLNGDGFVGVDDLMMILGAWNQILPVNELLADPSGDGFVGIDDLNIILSNWNAAAPAQLSIPEPSTIGLMTACLVVLSDFRRPGATR